MINERLSVIGLAISFCFISSRLGTLHSEITADNIIKQFKSKWANIHSYQVRMQSVNESMGMKNVVKSKGLVKGEKMRIESVISNPKMKEIKQLLIHDGLTTWIYQKQFSLVTKIDFSRFPDKYKKKAMSSSRMEIPEGVQFAISETKNGQDTLYVLKSPPGLEMDQGTVATYEYVIDPKNLNIVQIKAYGKKKFRGQEIEFESLIEYSDYRLNLSLSDSLFAFTVPKNAAVKDVTDETLAQLKATASSK